MDNTWVKLHRRILENVFLMHDDNAYMVFTKLLLMVGKEKGQWAGGRTQLGELVNLNPRTLYGVLIRLENNGLINITANNRYSVITICNWSKYQAKPDAAQQTSQLRDNNHATTTQHSNKNKKENKTYTYAQLQPELDAFLKHRSKLRAGLTPDGVLLIVKKLEKFYPDNPQAQKECLNLSIERGWKGVFKSDEIADGKKVLF